MTRRSRGRSRAARPACALTALFLAACTPSSSTPSSSTPHPFTLSWVGDRRDPRFAGHEALARKVAGSYVRVVVLAPSAPGAGTEDQGGGDQGGMAPVASASGVVIDRRGYVLTAAHIARDTAFTAEVTLPDGSLHPARILDVDPDHELALLRTAPLPDAEAATLAPPGSLHEGDPVLAIGTPGDVPGVVSLGMVVSPRWPGRVTYGDGRFGFDDGVKLSIDVEPGNSGGPGFDWEGRLIGILAGFVLGEESDVNYIPPRLAYLVPADGIRRYLARLPPP